MTEYRPFRNSDPPRILALWEQGGLGRGAALGLTNDAFEIVNYSQPYFDKAGLILAEDEGELVGFIHAAISHAVSHAAGDPPTGVIYAVVVHPEHRRRGIGRELVSRAESYLSESGVAPGEGSKSRVLAGPAPPHDLFYCGLYGGVRPCGFLESDPAAAPFFTAVGYGSSQRFASWQRDLEASRDPMNMKIAALRRKTELAVADRPGDAQRRWFTRFGRLDSLQFLLVPKSGGDPLADATVTGLECFIPRWGRQAAGVTGLRVLADDQEAGYDEMLLVEVCRRLREEQISLIDFTADEADEQTTAMLESTGFVRVDAGVVYRRMHHAE